MDNRNDPSPNTPASGYPAAPGLANRVETEPGFAESREKLHSGRESLMENAKEALDFVEEKAVETVRNSAVVGFAKAHVVEPAGEFLAEHGTALLEKVPTLSASQGSLVADGAEMLSKGMTRAGAGLVATGEFVEAADIPLDVAAAVGAGTFLGTKQLDNATNHMLSDSLVGRAEGIVGEKTGLFAHAWNAEQKLDHLAETHPDAGMLEKLRVGGEAFVRGESHEDFTHGIQRQINQHLAATNHPVGSITYEEAEKIAEVVQHAGKRDSLTIDAHGKVELVEPHNGAMLVTSAEPHTAVFPTEIMKQTAMLIPENQVSVVTPPRAPEAQHVEQSHANEPHNGPAMEL